MQTMWLYIMSELAKLAWADQPAIDITPPLDSWLLLLILMNKS